MHSGEHSCEIFVMRQPHYGDGRWTDSQMNTLRGWNILKETIERCGGHVITDQAPTVRHKEQRNGMFVRDTGIVLDIGNGSKFYSSEKPGAATRSEKRHVMRRLKKSGIAETVYLPNSMDGGDTIYDPSRRILFVGIKNYDYMLDVIEGLLHEKIAADTGPPTLAVKDHAQRRQYAATSRGWLHAAKHKLHASHETPVRVVGLFIPDHQAIDTYHLDGAFNVLPSGQSVWCPELLSNAARHLITTHFPSAERHAVSRSEAQAGATNFITVNKHIITPYAPFALSESFARWGYKVVDPLQVGQETGTWNFGPGAYVRCATLKVTPDSGFPLRKLCNQSVRLEDSVFRQ